MEDALEMALLFDYYGELLTPRQQMCFDMKYNQDLSLSEIAEELQVSRQGVYDNISRAETLLRNMEAKTGCLRRDQKSRAVMNAVKTAAERLTEHSDGEVTSLAGQILSAIHELEE